MKIALVRNTKIVEFVDAPFPVHADLTFVDVDDDTTLQDSFVNGEVDQERSTRNLRLDSNGRHSFVGFKESRMGCVSPNTARFARLLSRYNLAREACIKFLVL